MSRRISTPSTRRLLDGVAVSELDDWLISQVKMMEADSTDDVILRRVLLLRA